MSDPTPSTPPGSQPGGLYHTSGIVVWLWAFFFTTNAIAASILTAFSTKVVWATMSGQDRFLLCTGIVLTWTNTMGAFISKVVARGGASKVLASNGGSDTATFYRAQPPVIPPTTPKTG